MTHRIGVLHGLVLAARTAAAAQLLARLARAARTAAPITATAADDEADTAAGDAGAARCTVVVPARDEEGRLGPLLDALRSATHPEGGWVDGIADVIVVDDESSDATADVARRHGAHVVTGQPLPAGWAGKAWAVQQGVAAAGTPWVVVLDADTRPDPRLVAALVQRAEDDRLDLLTVAGRFRCPTVGARWLHAAMLTTLVARFGPPGQRRPDPARLLANGQCLLVRAGAWERAGGMHPVRGHVVEDVALARAWAAAGRRVAMLDAGALLTTEMYADLPSTWRGWTRSLALPGVEPRWRALLDAAVLVLAVGMPLPRLLARRADALDLLLLAARAGTLVGTARAYEVRGPAYWLSPLADLPAAASVAIGAVTLGHRWRGRTYVSAAGGSSAAPTASA